LRKIKIPTLKPTLYKYISIFEGMATLSVTLRTDQPNKKDGSCRIIILYRNGNEIPYKHSVGKNVLPEHFDFGKEKVIKHKKASEINYLIEQQKKIISDIVFDLERDEIVPTTKRVKALVKKVVSKKAVESLAKSKITSKLDKEPRMGVPLPEEAWHEMIDLKKNLIDEDTISIYRTTLKHLINYCILHNRKLNWELFDNDFYNHWSNYFIEDCENQYGDIGLSNNTIGKYFKTLKTFLYWGIDKEYHSSLKFKRYKVIQEEIDIYPLTESHLAQIVAFCDDDKNEFRLRKVASLFVFLATTGLRFSDGQKLVYGDFSYSGEGDIEQQVLKITSEKTDQNLLIPLNIYSLREITRNALDFEQGKLKISDILKPKDDFFDFGDLRKFFNNKLELEQPLLPQISSVKFNKYIKEVAEQCNFVEQIKVTRKSGSAQETKRYHLWEKISSHDCRRTFITLSLAKGMRPETVMSITGHTSYKTMLRYNKLTDKVKIEEFQSVWGKSEKTFDDVFGNAELSVGKKTENKD